MTKRIKLTGPMIRTRSELEGLMGEIRGVTIRQMKLQAEREARLKAVDDEYRDRLGQIKVELETKTELARGWAEANPSEFNGLKSLVLTHGVLGWRTGNPTLKTLAGWTWDRVLEQAQRLGLLQYVRTKQEVDKQQVLADREMLAAEQLRGMGLRVVQEEGFFVEPKIDEE